MKTAVWVSYNYGGWSLVFKKDFTLPFTPFFGMSIFEKNDSGVENDIRFDTNDYCKTTIQYKSKDNSFYLEARNVWKYPVMDGVIDEIIDTFNKMKWERIDRTNIDNLKKLMSRNC